MRGGLEKIVCPLTNKEEKEMDNDFTVAVRTRNDELAAEKKVETQDAVPSNFFITVKDLQEHGYFPGCPGCLSILRGKGRQGHSAACRKRFKDILGTMGK